MSALGQKQTYAPQQPCPLYTATAKADMPQWSCPLYPQSRHVQCNGSVCFGGKADMSYSTTSPANQPFAVLLAIGRDRQGGEVAPNP
jgi:hypothetical protein